MTRVLIIHNYPRKAATKADSKRTSVLFPRRRNDYPLSPSAKARRQNIRVSRRGRQLPPFFALAEPKVGSGKREGLVCSPLLLSVDTKWSFFFFAEKGGWKRLQVFHLSIHNIDNQQACLKNAETYVLSV
jgi:hypothetical protein